MGKILFMSALKAVIFDLGHTIIDYGKVDVDQLFADAGRRSFAFLNETFPERMRGVSFKRYSARHNRLIRWNALKAKLTGREFNCEVLLEKELQGYQIFPDEQTLRQITWSWYEPLHERGQVESDIHQTLGRLREMGLRLGILSNTFLPEHILNRHLEELGLDVYFSPRLFSSEHGIRKPGAAFFQMALDGLASTPGETLMVGDMPLYDMKGALRSGLHAVFKWSSSNRGRRIPRGVPQIERLGELPDHIAERFGGTMGDHVHPVLTGA